MDDYESSNMFRDVQQLYELPLPSLLVELIAAGQWENPGGTKMRECVPFIEDDLDFLCGKQVMVENSFSSTLSGNPENQIYREYRGSANISHELPWVDAEKTLFMIISGWPGSDAGIALDYRTGLQSPRVVGTDWQHERAWRFGKKKLMIRHRNIADSFEAFVKLIGL